MNEPIDVHKWEEADWEKFFEKLDAEKEQMIKTMEEETIRKWGEMPKTIKEACRASGIDYEEFMAMPQPSPLPLSERLYWEEDAPKHAVPVFRQAYAFTSEIGLYLRRHVDDPRLWDRMGGLATTVTLEIGHGHDIGYARELIRGNLVKLNRAHRAARQLSSILWSRRGSGTVEEARLFNACGRLETNILEWSSHLRTKFLK